MEEKVVTQQHSAVGIRNAFSTKPENGEVPFIPK